MNDFVNKINNFKVSENSFLVTMDVKTLYTNISNKEGIANENTTTTQRQPSGFPLLGGTWGGDPPHYPKNWLVPPHVSSHCFDPNMPVLSFSYSFWPFCPNCPPH